MKEKRETYTRERERERGGGEGGQLQVLNDFLFFIIIFII